jgi:hypothetical protein
MGDVKSETAQVTQLEKNPKEFEIILPNGEHAVSIKFSDNGDLVQTAGIPLDSNTLHSISESIKDAVK